MANEALSPAASAAPAGTALGGSPLRSQQHPEGDAQSGPAVALLFQRALAAMAMVAFTSLALQVPVLIGSRGLLPAGEFFARADRRGTGFWDAPSVLWAAHGDGVLMALSWLGVWLGLLALFGVRPRLCFLLGAPLYLSFTVVASDFTAFQWDNMLVETLLLAALLPVGRPAPLVHFALRLLLFKLYFESGIAKWQSHLHDWQDGSAMRFYYETAPLPATLAYYAHQLPAWVQKLSSWGALVLELLVPFLIFGPRRARLTAFVAFTGFQLVNTATANYGFFTYLSLLLHLFLLGDRDVRPLLRRLGLRPRAAAAPSAGRIERKLVPAMLATWVLLSLVSGIISLGRAPQLEGALLPLYSLAAPLRVANAYHLFGHITRERIEPQFETRVGTEVREHDLRWKPGDVRRRPPYVAPHQPRVDFRLWFYGLSAERGMPRYVSNLLDRMCRDPRAVQSLFAGPLPRAPDAVTISLYRYRFTTLAQKRETGAYWTRELIGTLPERRCR